MSIHSVSCYCTQSVVLGAEKADFQTQTEEETLTSSPERMRSGRGLLMLLPPVPFQMKSMPNYNRTYDTHMYISRSHMAGRNACVKCYKGNAGNGGGCAAVARLSGSAAVTAAASLFVHFRTSHRDCRILPAAAPINSEHSCSVKRGHVCMEV